MGIVNALISVVDDDESVRESLPELLQVLGYAARAFGSAADFLASDALAATRCLLLDVSMPGMSGPELQSELATRQSGIPIIFMTALRDDQLRATLLARGAVDCLYKPFNVRELRLALGRAIPKP
jgi:FixJ family two-component response regulator